MEEGGRLVAEGWASHFRWICVCWGSAKDRKASYQDTAVELGKEMVTGFVWVKFELFLASMRGRLKWIGLVIL
ncbi:hypothetical protein ZWY2020_024231 [Hordeum vulgare]|nr:hypothetical protein ZWY2020_024231 [Hordeum vulgare]